MCLLIVMYAQFIGEDKKLLNGQSHLVLKGILDWNGGWMDGASTVYPYATSIHPEGRYKIEGRKICEEGSIQKYRYEGLKDFDAHGIDYRMLFPDSIGAALHANARVNWNII